MIHRIKDVEVLACVAVALIYVESLGGPRLGFIGPWRLSRWSIRGWNGGHRETVCPVYSSPHPFYIPVSFSHRDNHGVKLLWRNIRWEGSMQRGRLTNCILTPSASAQRDEVISLGPIFRNPKRKRKIHVINTHSNSTLFIPFLKPKGIRDVEFILLVIFVPSCR
jgi:hypothetical protein